MEQKSTRKKNAILVIIIIIMSFLIAFFVWQLVQGKNEIKKHSFVEGEVCENIVTVKNNWLVYDSETFNELINGANFQISENISDYLVFFFSAEIVQATQEDYLKLEYSKAITIEENGNSKHYYMVGDYFVTPPDTMDTESEDIAKDIAEN